MRHRSRFLPVLIVALWAGFSSPAKADVDISVFVETLSPYGTWVNHPLYGQAWFPRGMPAGWRPYTDGHWVYTEEFGWTWESDWDWGWAPFHYGRWAWDDWYGWIWIPGRVWAPAWVFWRFGGGFVAWAPMPPDVVWWPGFGLHSPRFHEDRDLPWDFWNCVEARHFPDRRIHHRILAPNNNINIIKITQNVTNVTVINNRIVNRSISLQPIERAFGRRINAERVREVDDLAMPRGEQRRGELMVIRPRRIEALPPADEREQEELANRIAEERQAHRQTPPEQFKPRVPRRFFESQGRETGRQERPRVIEEPRQLQERGLRQQQESQRQQEQQRQSEEQMQRQQELERRGVEQQRREEEARKSQERVLQQQQELQRQQEQQRQRAEQMQRQQELERRSVEQHRREEEARKSQERVLQQQQEIQRQQEQRRQEQMQRQQEPPRQIQQRPQRQPLEQRPQQRGDDGSGRSSRGGDGPEKEP